MTMRRRIYQYQTRSGRNVRWIAARSETAANRYARAHRWHPLNNAWGYAEILGRIGIKCMKPSQLRGIGVDVVLS
jgi:hypothetical protein